MLIVVRLVEAQRIWCNFAELVHQSFLCREYQGVFGGRYIECRLELDKVGLMCRCSCLRHSNALVKVDVGR